LLAVSALVDRGVTVPTPPAIVFVGCVDSGAHRTLLPLSLAIALGLDAATELTQDAGASGGVGSTFDTWSSTVPVHATVMAFLQPGQPAQPWGPTFRLNPAFTDLQPDPSPLLGRADFFRAFAVTFNEDDQSPSFTITER
jgi:hypothetical protein